MSIKCILYLFYVPLDTYWEFTYRIVLIVITWEVLIHVNIQYFLI